MKMPAFQFYPADWRKDPGVQALDRHDRSVWFDMLCIMHESDERGVLLLAGRPIPEDALARMLNLDNQTFNQTLTNILTYGVASRRESDGAIYSRRMVKDEKLCQTRREAGKKGGNPGLVNQKSKQKPTTGVNQIPTPSSSTSSSMSSNEDVAASPANPFPAKSPDPATSSARAAALASTDPADEQRWEVGPLTKPDAFKAICERMGYPEIDFEYYRRAALMAAEDGDISRTIKQWNSWVRRFLENQGRPLLTPAAGASLPSKPTPINQLPKPGQEKPGQPIYIDGVPGDQNMDRMKAASFLKHFPTAVVVSLAYPQNPYRNTP
jgi:hypothetical protein